MAVTDLTGYSITYHANGGLPIPQDLTEQTELPTPLPVVSKSGYRFMGWYTDSTFTTQAVAGASISADTDLYAKFEEEIDVSDKTYYIKLSPTFTSEKIIHGNFTSGDESFTQISIMDYDGDWEIWYVSSGGSVQAYGMGQWEVEYRYLTFDTDEVLIETEYNALLSLYDEYIAKRKLYINGELAVINGKRKGSITYNGVVYEFDNGSGKLVEAYVEDETLYFTKGATVEGNKLILDGGTVQLTKLII